MKPITPHVQVPETVPTLWLFCSDLESIPGKPSCCGSCHRDQDDYGCSACGSHLSTDRIEVELCCWVANWLEQVEDPAAIIDQAAREKAAREAAELEAA